MQKGPIIWNGDIPIQIQNESHIYDVLFYYDDTERQSFWAFVRREDSRFALVNVQKGEVYLKYYTLYDDLYLYDVDKYHSIGQFNYLPFPMEIYETDYDYPMCFVDIGVNGLLTCHPVKFDQDSTQSPFKFYPSFVCESFNEDYYYLHGCVYNHDMSSGRTGKGWFKEIHKEIHYDPEPAFNNYACYQYERDINSSMGKWIIEDEANSEDRTIIKDVYASNIIFADLWGYNNTISIGIEVENTFYPSELLIYDKRQEIELRDHIQCTRWRVYETKNDTLFVIMYGQSIKLYSLIKGFLSSKYYRNLYLDDIPLAGRTIPLLPAKDSDQSKDFLTISESGDLGIVSR